MSKVSRLEVTSSGARRRRRELWRAGGSVRDSAAPRVIWRPIGSPEEGRLSDEAAALVPVEIAAPEANSPPGNCRFEHGTQ